MKHFKFSITLQSELLLGQSKLSRLLATAAPWYSQCAARMAPSCMNMAWPAAGGCQGVAQPERRLRTLSKFRQAVMFALDLDQWQFAIRGKVPQHHDGSVCVGMSSMDTGRLEMLKGMFWRPHGSPFMAYLARIPGTVLLAISKIPSMAAAFLPATEVPIIRHCWASVVLIVAVWGKYCHSNATDGRNLRATVS